MKTLSHFVAANHADTGLNYVLPFSAQRQTEVHPQRIVQWGCAGPCVIGWGRNVVPHKALPDELFMRPNKFNAAKTIGNWFRKRR